MSDEERVPLRDVVGGLEVHPFRDGEIPLEAIVLAKMLTEDGRPAWRMRWTAGLDDPIDRIGPLVGYSDSDRDDVVRSLRPEDADE